MIPVGIVVSDESNETQFSGAVWVDHLPRVGDFLTIEHDDEHLRGDFRVLTVVLKAFQHEGDGQPGTSAVRVQRVKA
jgi:hypothetical protein